MTLTIKLFAALRDLAGTDTVTVVLPDGATVGALRLELGNRLPLARSLLARSAVAVNHDTTDDEHVLSPADECAVIPPVSGG
ncbi:MoaD/ThiS family protein [Gemmata sp. JC717]|uniref:MoaD/ThiS family protein n=1 Tax=Gemmata algarum TaxID=2975278 RepID=UPI0021BA5869|nr:MoaD/ThiS family protein [Gemmata algarum]MDY3555722.1 MoaD/ThiS family protein [Gemmata algarum]